MQDTALVGFGARAPDFRLPGVDGRSWSLKDCRGAHGTVVMFICNHCPYVKATIDRMVAVATDLEAQGVKSVAICANDAETFPEDSFEQMRAFARAHRFGFPYLHDESQVVTRAYGALCTPDYFGYNEALELQYRGRLDEGRTAPPAMGARRELFEAMKQIARTGKGPQEQFASVGCSVKWKK